MFGVSMAPEGGKYHIFPWFHNLSQSCIFYFCKHNLSTQIRNLINSLACLCFRSTQLQQNRWWQSIGKMVSLKHRQRKTQTWAKCSKNFLRKPRWSTIWAQHFAGNEDSPYLFIRAYHQQHHRTALWFPQLFNFSIFRIYGIVTERETRAFCLKAAFEWTNRMIFDAVSLDLISGVLRFLMLCWETIWH